MPKIAPDSPAKPTMQTLAPDWLRLTAKLLELGRTQDAMREELLELDRRKPPHYHEAMFPPTNSPVRPDKPLDPRVVELLGEFAPAQKPPDVPAGTLRWSCDWARESHEFNNRSEAVQKAIAALHPELARARAEGSRRLCAALADEYNAVASAVCEAMVRLLVCWAEHQQFVRSVVLQGADPAFFRLLNSDIFDSLGDPTNSSSQVRQFLSWAIHGGHFDPESIPADLIRPARVDAPAPAPGTKKRGSHGVIWRTIRLRPEKGPGDAAGRVA